MLAENTLKATFIHSPIGTIPKLYPRLTELCRAASIRYKDKTVKRGDETATYRDWMVVIDGSPASDSRGNKIGTASTKFKKFEMLLDYLVHNNPGWNRMMILDEAIDQTDPTVQKLMRMSWQQMHDEMARMGVHGYDILRKQKSANSIDMPDF